MVHVDTWSNMEGIWLMKKPKCTPKHGLKSGWTRWQEPVMEGYLMQCCDCDLIHVVDFKVLKVTSKKNTKNGYWEAEEMPTDKYRVSLRMKRYEETV